MNFRKIILDTAIKMYETKLVAGTSGNISMRNLEKEDSYFITPSSIPYYDMTEDDIVEINSKGESLSGGKPSSEWKLHVEIYNTYPEYNAIVHTHSTFATAFAVAREDIPLISVEMDYKIEVAPFAKAGSWEVAKKTAPFLKEKRMCLMANHGTVSCGKDMRTAYIGAEYIEDAAKIYYYAKNIGKPYILGD